MNPFPISQFRFPTLHTPHHPYVRTEKHPHYRAKPPQYAALVRENPNRRNPAAKRVDAEALAA